MENGKTYAPYYCHSIPNFNMRTCEFVIPRESLIHHSALLLASAKGRPGAIQMESIVKQHNQVLLYKYKPLMGSRFALNKEDAATMQSLHGLDDSVATTLPPLPPGVKELRSECKIESQEITQAQYDAVTTGESIERLECDFGESAAVVASTRGRRLLDYEWKMKSGGYAFVTVAPSGAKTVIEKHATK